MTKILVDVDGCLNKFGELTPDDDQFYVNINGVECRIEMNRSLGGKLLELSRETGADLMWASMWEHLANEYLSERLGFPELPYVRMTRKFSDWHIASIKSRNVAEQVHEPFVWFDDDYDLAATFPQYSTGLESRIIQTDELTGLTDHDIVSARQWLLDHQN